MSFKCSQAEQWVSVKVDGELLPGSVSGSLEEHLKACPSCQRALAEETKRSQLLGAALQESGTLRFLSAAILEAAARAESGEITERGPAVGRDAVAVGRDRWARWWLAGSAAAAVLILGGFLIFRDLVPMGGSSIDRASPFKVFLEQDTLQTDVVPADDGSPWRREVLKKRRTLLDDLSPPGLRGAPPPKLDMEQQDTRYLRLASYPYR